MSRSTLDSPVCDERGVQPGSVTRRAVILALVAVPLVVWAGFGFDIHTWAAPRFSAGVPASGPFALLFLLTVIATLGPLCRWLRLQRGELLTIYMIVLVGAPLVSTSIMANLLAHSTIQRYLGESSMPQWQGIFLKLIPNWFGPTDLGSIGTFYRGGSAVPWLAWFPSLLAWGSFLLALSVCSVCLVLLLRRQWITHERLTFPLAQIPLETVATAGAGKRGGSPTPVARLPVAPLFWLGLLISLGLTSLETLSRYFPAIPSVPLGPVTVMPWQPVGPIAGLGEIDVVLWPWLIALAYLMPKELSFSCWFFWFVRLGLTVMAISAGAAPLRPESWWTSEFPAPVYQGAGALLAICAISVWSARRHLGYAVRAAFGRRHEASDPDEPFPYRWVLIAFGLSFAWLLGFCLLTGSRALPSIALILTILVYYLAWNRLRAETGLGFLPYPFFPHEIIMVPFGSRIFRPQELILIHATTWSYLPNGGNLEAVSGNVMESMKIADTAAIGKRRLVLAMAGGFLAALLTGVYISLNGIYRHGFFNLSSTPDQLKNLYGYSWYLERYLTNPSTTDVNGTVAIAVGALVTLFLAAMRLRFWWWPFHPIGYLAASTWVMYMDYMPFLVGWLAKTLVMRYGGLRFYRQTIPLAVGLVAGDLLNEVLWGAITLVTGQPFRPPRHW